MRTWVSLAVAIATAGSAWAAPNIAQNAQKGSLLVFPDVDVRDNVTTIVRIQNDSTKAVLVKCYFMDGQKRRNDFSFLVTRGQPIWFDAATGAGTVGANPFPSGTGAGLLACFAVNENEDQQVRWNHLSGTATVVDYGLGTAYEYSAWAFFGHRGQGDGAPIPTPPGFVLPAPCVAGGYVEVFPNNEATDAKARAVAQGWVGVRGGGTTNELQIFDPGSATPATPLNSFPAFGPGNKNGYAFWSPKTHDVTIYTSEYSVPASEIVSVSFETRHSGQNAATPDIDRLALRVNGVWYISQAFVTTLSDATWQPNSIGVRSTLWALGVVNPGDPAGAGPRQPALADFTLPFPATGMVDAVGIFTTDNDFGGVDILGNHRYDNFTVYAGPDAGPDCTPDPTEGDQVLGLDGSYYDKCPATLIGLFSPEGALLGDGLDGKDITEVGQTRAVFVGCNMDLRQKYQRYDTKLSFDVWNENELKLTGAHDCADGWHETWLTDMAAQGDNFSLADLKTEIARYRVTSTKDDFVCAPRKTSKVGLLGVQATDVTLNGGFAKHGTHLTAVGNANGFLVWTMQGAIEEGGIR